MRLRAFIVGILSELKFLPLKGFDVGIDAPQFPGYGYVLRAGFFATAAGDAVVSLAH